MFQPSFFYSAFLVFLSMAVVVILMLTIGKIEAPYGKLKSKGWGSVTIPSRWSWLIMESPSSIIFLILLLQNKNPSNGVIALFIIWQVHYFYRSFIYPFITKHSSSMPLIVMISAVVFQLSNTYFQAGWIFVLAPESMYGGDYLYSWQFILGLILFITGTIINRYSDNILKNLRAPGETDYKIPYGGLYRWVSCPNYLGEMIIWLGWAIMLKSIIGFSFFLWTIANLAPRAISTHRWYLKKFSDYPKDRKALVPYIL